MTHKQQQLSIRVSTLFYEFLNYLVQLGYSDSIENIVEGVFQRAFFEEWIDYLAKRKLTGLQSTVDYIKEELLGKNNE